MTIYPGAIDSLEDCENTAVQSVEQTLGINPQGGFPSVAARLQNIDTRFLSDRIFKVQDYNDYQAAIDAASAAGGGFVLFPWGVTPLMLDAATGRFITLKPGVSLCGFGAQSVLRVPNSAGNFKTIIGNDTPLADITISDLTIDGNQAGNAPADIEAFAPIRNEFNSIVGFNQPRVAMMLAGGNRVTVSSVQIRQLDSINHVALWMSDVEIRDCYFEMVTTFEHDHSSVYIHGTRPRIINNRFVGVGAFARTAIETHGSDQYVRENSVTNFRRGMNVTGYVHQPEGTYAATIKDNHLFDCEIGISLWSGALGENTTNQRFVDVVVADNIIRLNKTLWPNTNINKAIWYELDNSRPLEGVILRDNLMRVLP